MTSTSQADYQVLRDYLNSLLLPTCPDQPLAEVPMALRPELAAFLRGKTGYEDETGRQLIYAADLAAWARDLIHGAGLAAPLLLATLDLTALRMATQRQA
jgi:hypothetical protein